MKEKQIKVIQRKETDIKNRKKSDRKTDISRKQTSDIYLMWS